MRPLALVSLGCLGPHLANIFEHHVHVTIEGLHAPQNLPVVAAINEHQRVGLDCLGQKREGTLVESVFLRRVLLFVGHCKVKDLLLIKYIII